MAPVRVLITGGSGFVGQWLCRRFVGAGHTVFVGGVGAEASPGILDAEQRRAVRRLTLDVTSPESIARALDEASPEWVVHLAAIAFTPDANAAGAATFDVNALGAWRLLTALATRKARGVRVLVVGSAEEYGPHPESEYPIAESAQLLPLTLYAASKAAQELIALQTGREHGIDVICTRSFNHTGVGHDKRYLLPRLVESAKRLPGRGGVLPIGNPTVRDYLHVADVADAYLLLLEKGAAGEVYNVASGKGTTARELAERVLNRLGIAAEITLDPVLARPSDIPISIGDSTRLRRTTGWAPKFTIDDIIDDLIHAATR